MKECYADKCVLPLGHEPEPHQAANGYEWSSVIPRRFRIEHRYGRGRGDEAEAESYEAAVVAARTLLEDNGFVGSCRIFDGKDIVDVVWADNADSFTHTSTKRRDY